MSPPSQEYGELSAYCAYWCNVHILNKANSRVFSQMLSILNKNPLGEANNEINVSVAALTWTALAELILLFLWYRVTSLSAKIR